MWIVNRPNFSLLLKTDYLILGENPGSKLLEAQDKNVTIINFSQLKSLIEEGILPNG